jgi:hypothetical protein
MCRLVLVQQLGDDAVTKFTCERRYFIDGVHSMANIVNASTDSCQHILRLGITMKLTFNAAIENNDYSSIVGKRTLKISNNVMSLARYVT